ncbi:MAG TPA: hypothetical protein VKT73_08500 [Xanthobacteraceae bacterium]|nr:hypothetical protein [Xanthobacteraceae bacterium]
MYERGSSYSFPSIGFRLVGGSYEEVSDRNHRHPGAAERRWLRWQSTDWQGACRRQGLTYLQKLLAAGIAAAALISASAPARAALPAPLFNWTGFYIGGQAGYGWGDSRQFDPFGNSTAPYQVR